MSKAVSAGNFKVNNVSFSAVKSLENGGKMIYMNNGEGINPIYIQTPEMKIPFDANYFADDGKDESVSNSGKYSFSLSMDNIDDDEKMKALHDVMTSLDEYIKKEAKKNCSSWFKKPKMSEETINELYTPIVKVSIDQETGEPNGAWAPKIAFKVKKKDGKFVKFSVYDKSKTYFDIDKVTENPVDIRNVIMKGALVKVVLKCNGIWIANGKFGCTWVAEQMRIKVPEGGLRDFAIMSDSDEEEEEEKVESSGKPLMIEDSDDDDDEEVKEPSPPPESKKKTRKVKVKSTN